jgi:hypothetical protein
MADEDEQRALSAADRLADLCVDVAGPGLRSVVLHGSLAAGGFRPGRSDIDLLAVVDGRLSDSQAAAIEQGVRTADAGPADRVDLHVVTSESAGHPTRTPALELQVGRYGDEVDVARGVTDADLLAELSMARSTGRSLRGAEPVDVIAPVPPEWVVERNRYWLTTWRDRTDDEKNAAFMVLTACRMWWFALEHVHCSKPDAAAWALARDPSLDVVRQALRQYDVDPVAPVDADGIALLLDLVLRDTAPLR